MHHNLHFITSNKAKAKETEAILGFPITVVHMETEEIQSLSLEAIAKQKVTAAFQILQKPLFVDDVSVQVLAWNGFPGPFIKFIQQTGGNELLLKMLGDEKERRAVVQASVGYHNGKEIHVFKGIVEGTIAKESLGSDGWGFDTIFIPKGYTKTFAQLGSKLKNTKSHRSLALREFKKYLDRTA